MLSVWSLVESSPNGVDFNEGVKHLSEFRYKESPEIQLQDNDILIAKDGDIGRIGFIKKLLHPATVNSHVAVVRIKNKKIEPEFLYWFMKSITFQTYCKSYTTGTTVPLLTQKDLKNSQIIIPPIDEQKKIVNVLSIVDARLLKLQSKKNSLKSLKKGLMQKLLTGQILVN